MRYATNSALLSAARVKLRYGTDGFWHWCSYEDGKVSWESDGNCPAASVAALQFLKAELKLSWPDACRATMLLAANPWDPATSSPAPRQKEAATTTS
jgi:hypothetical protein